VVRDDPSETPGAPVEPTRRWDDLLPYLGGSALLTLAPVGYVLLTGADWNGVAGVLTLMMGVTTLLLAVATGGFYLFDEL
jgi:hypothetical protein